MLVARAARFVAEHGLSELTGDLVSAFDRFLEHGSETDKSCVAKTAIVKALVDLEHPAVGLFRKGLGLVQMEGAFGGPVDTAIEVRANSALGLVNAGTPHAVQELVPLLVDPGLPARLAAAQAIAASGQVEAEAVLRLKVLAGDAESEVLAECLLGLLRLVPSRSLPFVRGFLEKPHGGFPTAPRGAAEDLRSAPQESVVRQAAILAFGESRLEAAVPVLTEHWERERDPEVRRTILLALVTSRHEAAFDFLLAQVAGGTPSDAGEAIRALAVLRHHDTLRERVEGALARHPAAQRLRMRFEREFG